MVLPANGELHAQVAHSGQVVDVTQVHVLVVAVELAELGPGGLVPLGDVVVDPHPPAWVELGRAGGQRLEQLLEPKDARPVHFAPDQNMPWSTMISIYLATELAGAPPLEYLAPAVLQGV